MGQNLCPENGCLGKMTSNQIELWGATLWDFFWVHRIPNSPTYITISTGSKLSKWMMEHKEIQPAASEIEWAQIEADPREINPYQGRREIDNSADSEQTIEGESDEHNQQPL